MPLASRPRGRRGTVAARYRRCVSVGARRYNIKAGRYDIVIPTALDNDPCRWYRRRSPRAPWREAKGADAPARRLRAPLMSQRPRPLVSDRHCVVATNSRLYEVRRSRALSWDSSRRSPVARFLSSTVPAFRPRGPTTSCQGRPIRSMSANLTPGRSSRSS